MREVKNNKQYTEAEGSAAIHIDLSDDASGCGSNDRCGIGKEIMDTFATYAKFQQTWLAMAATMIRTAEPMPDPNFTN